MKEMKVRLTFINPILGTASGNPELHSEFIASKAPDAQSREQEIEALGVDAVEKKEMTVFSRTPDGRPCLWDYHIRGFFKHACGMQRLVKGTVSSGIKAYKKYIDGLVFVKERQIPINYVGKISSLQRPLRASTAQGERITLANSEMIPEKASVEFTILMLKEDLEDAVREWLDYGQFNGIGQWRNASYGAFLWQELDDNGNASGGNLTTA